MTINRKTKSEIRDSFAKAALTGLLINQNTEQSAEELSKQSYDIADAMMEKRSSSLGKDNQKSLRHVFLDMAARCDTIEDEEGCVNCDLFNQVSKGGGCKYAMSGACTNRHKLIFKYRK